MSEVIPHWLTKQATLRPEKVAIETDDGTCITFIELQDMSMSYAKKLAHIGVRRGDHVGVLSMNHIDMVVTIHALSYLGAVVVLLNTRLTEKELSYQITHADIVLLLVCNVVKERFPENAFSVMTKSFQEINVLQEAPQVLQTELCLDDPFTIMYTSGTTGRPKGVVHTYGNHWWSAIGSALNLGIHDTDKWLTTLPIFHVGGLSVFLKSVIYGMPVYFIKKFSERNVIQAIMNEGVTIASVVTVMVQRVINMLDHVIFPETFRCMLLGGGPAPKSLLSQAAEKNIPIYQSYGLTETSSQIATIQPQDARRKIGSAGKALTPAQLKISEPDILGIGEIVVKGPMVTSGYFKDPESSRKAIQHGWLSTGDLGYVDTDGFLYVVDRRTDLIISGGENVYPTEIENIISEMDLVEAVGVVGKDHPTWGEVPIAVIVPKTRSLTSEQVLQYVADKLAPFKVPKEVYFASHLPRNAANKIVRQKLLSVISNFNYPNGNV